MAFGGRDLIDDLKATARTVSLDGIPVKTANMEAILLARQNQKKRFDENQEILKKSILIHRHDV